ncbi:MAG: UDP-2,4-diacetamido-2,4,6-trideoxy-beta-L-altropyranose hydrolase [Sphingopyxis sp.]|uniref:UDP-2,4-diacetamido-2,4, 6-trideoxy-beta-L-altropyranose hydrolase n=1 Tax=Sphingopyxis sp. TaxID=1908224 RepID=UPI001A52548B|nr:UDP-2,4-diacetamido-2,4,6-trideoxy-beta-L-altropyranose hydrolase [Sphingopyxis sp.]MBL9066188.1 UDP-2,4-diacetamido-2,4,6-trideoxy-beta-L-altropyranose hydrolase [Sphingopyxis sp.]
MSASVHHLRIAIRADASAEMGTGHVRRCNSLANTLAMAGADVHLFARKLGVDTAALLSPTLALHELPAPPRSVPTSPDAPAHLVWARVSQERDVADMSAAIDSIGLGWLPDIVIVDHYAFDARWHNALRGRTGAKIAVIDDLGDRSIAADFVIDHNWHHDFYRKYAGRFVRPAELLVGPGFALLDPHYATVPRHISRDLVGSIGIFMGGSDAANSTARVLDAIETIAFKGHVEVVSTSANPNLGALRERLADNPYARLSLDLPNLADFFARHDLHIGAGGGATWERFCVGAPSILLSFALNHDQVLLPLQQLALAEVLPLGWNQNDLVAAVTKLCADPALRRNFSERGLSLVDGGGCQRVANRLMGG